MLNKNDRSRIIVHILRLGVKEFLDSTGWFDY